MDRVELERLEREFLRAFPDTQHVIEDLIGEDDWLHCVQPLGPLSGGSSAVLLLQVVKSNLQLMVIYRISALGDGLDHLRAKMAAFIEQYYNRDRLHSALGYKSPEEFEQAAGWRPPATGAPCGFSGLERLLMRRHQPGIILKQQTGCEEQHSLNHQVCLFQTVSTEGFTPAECTEFALKHVGSQRYSMETTDSIETSKVAISNE